MSYCSSGIDKTYLGCFASNETENDDFVFGKVLERFERSCTVAVILELRLSETSDTML